MSCHTAFNLIELLYNQPSAMYHDVMEQSMCYMEYEQLIWNNTTIVFSILNDEVRVNGNVVR